MEKTGNIDGLDDLLQSIENYETMKKEFAVGTVPVSAKEEYEQMEKSDSGNLKEKAEHNDKTETDKQDFVTISFSNNQITGDCKSGDGKEYYRILAPDGYTFIREKNKVKPSIVRQNASCFSVPENYSITLSKSIQVKAPVTDEHGNVIEKAVYDHTKVYITAKELYDLYKKQHDEYRSRNVEQFVTITVDSKYIGEPFEVPDKGQYVRVTAPGNISCLRPVEQVHKVKDSDKSTFTLRKDFVVYAIKNRVLKPAERDEDGTVTVPGEYESEKVEYTAEEFAGLFYKMNIIFDVNKVVDEVVSEETGKSYKKIIVQDGYTMLYPCEKLIAGSDDMFMIEAYPGYEYTLQRAHKNPNADDDGTENEKYIIDRLKIDAVKLSDVLSPMQKAERTDNKDSKEEHLQSIDNYEVMKKETRDDSTEITMEELVKMVNESAGEFVIHMEIDGECDADAERKSVQP